MNNSCEFQGYSEDAVITGPSIETYSEREDDTDIFMKDPYITASAGNIAKVPVIMGLMHTESEWSTLPGEKTPKIHWTQNVSSSNLIGFQFT